MTSGFTTWNPVKELKVEIKFPNPQNRNRWNPVKELKEVYDNKAHLYRDLGGIR